MEAYKITGNHIQPWDERLYYSDSEQMDPERYFKTYHMKKFPDPKNWEKARFFIQENTQPNLYFQLYFEK